MSALARRGALLAVVAAVLLANPLYVGLVVDEPRERSPTGYTATAVDPGNATDQRLLLREVGGDDVLELEAFAGTNDYQPYGDAYRAPGEAAAVLRRAVDEGRTRADGDAVEFTLNRALASYRYVAVGGRPGAEDETARYYRVRAEVADGATVVTATEVDRRAVVRYVFHRDARLYASLPDYQKETVRNVVADDDYGYRPYNDEFVDLTGNVLVMDDAYYVFSTGVHADDFGPSTHGLVSGVLGLFGVLFLGAGAVLTVLSYRRSGGDGGDGEDGDAAAD